MRLASAARRAAGARRRRRRCRCDLSRATRRGGGDTAPAVCLCVAAGRHLLAAVAVDAAPDTSLLTFNKAHDCGRRAGGGCVAPPCREKGASTKPACHATLIHPRSGRGDGERLGGTLFFCGVSPAEVTHPERRAVDDAGSSLPTTLPLCHHRRQPLVSHLARAFFLLAFLDTTVAGILLPWRSSDTNNVSRDMDIFCSLIF